MTRRHKLSKSKKQIITFITQYGIHIWAILIIANAVMVYTYQLATHAAGKSDTTLHALSVSDSPSPTVSPVSPSTVPSDHPSAAPLGPTVGLSFSVPGIGSGGGNLKPIHVKRNVTVFLFAPDVNSLIPSVKPLFTIQGSASYDTNPYSPTYTSFVMPYLDLGSNVKEGNYQIAFRTDQSLRTLIKQNPSDPGGEIFELGKASQTLALPPQIVLMGDTLPLQGDNQINISDYNAFINCFGSRNTTANFCKTGNYGDFNDDGIIDGVDYNILLRSLFALSQEGLPIPKVPTPTPTASGPLRITKLINQVTQPAPTKKVTAKPTPAQKTQSASGSSAAGGILFFFFLIILGAIGFVLYKKNDTIRNKVNALIHLSPTGKPAIETPSKTADGAQPAGQPAEAATETVTPGETAEQSSQETPPAAAAQPTPPAVEGVIEKECYVKKKGPDEAGTGEWLLLTDDNGPVQAHYAKNDAQDGFAKVKGVMKTENGKTFLEISELTPEG